MSSSDSTASQHRRPPNRVSVPCSQQNFPCVPLFPKSIYYTLGFLSPKISETRHFFSPCSSPYFLLVPLFPIILFHVLLFPETPHLGELQIRTPLGIGHLFLQWNPDMTTFDITIFDITINNYHPGQYYSKVYRTKPRFNDPWFNDIPSLAAQT